MNNFLDQMDWICFEIRINPHVSVIAVIMEILFNILSPDNWPLQWQHWPKHLYAFSRQGSDCFKHLNAFNQCIHTNLNI